MQNSAEANAGEAPTAVIDPSALSFCRPVPARLSRWCLVAALQGVEVLAVATSSFVWLNDIITKGGARTGLFELLTFALAVALVVHFVLRSLGAYEFAGILNVWRSSVTAAAAWILSTAPVLLWSIKLEPLWQNSFMDWLAGGALIMVVRLGAGYSGGALLLARRLGHNVAIVGAGPEAQCCARLLQSDRSGTNVVGFIKLEGGCANQLATARHANFIAELQQLIQLQRVKDVIVATSERDREQVQNLVRGLLCLPVCVLLWPPSIGIEAEWIASSKTRIGEMRLLLASAPPLDGWNWVLKDVQDRVLAFLLLTICAPVLLAIAVAIRLSDPGPVLFKQEREGYNGNKFLIFKFRTMYAAPMETDQLILTAKDDPRIFPLGAFLRKTSLDELPQLLNVLRGEMWLVGPRPHSPLATAAGQRYSAAVTQYMARFRVKPGITGWAQVNGWRGATNTIEQIQQRVIYDLYYIEHWSVWLDFQILLQTATRGLVDQNAY